MKWHQQLHWRIIIGLILGLVYGVLATSMGWTQFTSDWISPFGTIFINLLKLIAVPLVVASLVSGVASLSDLRKLSRIGSKTIGLYIVTTAIAITIGLAVVNVLNPGTGVPEDLSNKLQQTYRAEITQRTQVAQETKQRGPLQPIVDMVPSNFFSSASNNRNMLQVVFFAILFGVGLIQLPKAQAKPLIEIFEGLNHVVIRIVDVIMLMAPLGVFALLANTITSVAGGSSNGILELLGALGFYCLAVVFGLGMHTFLVIPGILKLLSPMNIKTFFKAIAPVQLLAFSTSSSGATLPLTMERCEENLGVSEEVSSFVLPLGATINMDGTALYQGVATVFIAQAMGISLDLGAQLTIVFTAVLASIGTAAVPGAGIIMLIVILESVGVPSEGIALILGVDRILDMLRTCTNVTGDAAVATVIAASEGQLGPANLSEEGHQVKTHN